MKRRALAAVALNAIVGLPACETVKGSGRVRVEINRIAIDGDTILPDSGEFNQLEGTVRVYEGLNAGNANPEVGLSNDEAVQSFPFRLKAETADGEAPEGWILVSPSKDDFYSVLVNAYADGVLDRIKVK
jgi:hypothetical protein